jgi:hypothetical protein
MMPARGVQVSLNFMPSFYHRHLGITYGEAYYFDPRYRAEVDGAENRFLHEILGRFGVGSRDPQPSATLFIQPIDMVKLTQGAQLRCPADATLETWGHPWSELTPGQIEGIDAQAAARHPVIDALIRQYHELHDFYGERADVFGIKAGAMTIHAPYTTAHQLCGESLFYLLMDDPDGAQRVFAKVWDIYRAIFARLVRELGAAPPRRLHLGDCSASLLSAEVYGSAVLPVNRALASEFPDSGYHSCGASSHLLQAFSGIPRLTTIELGAGTDMTAAVAALPGVVMRPLIDPVLMRDGPPARVEQTVTDLLTATATAPGTTLCAWSFDRDTPVRNVEAMYQTVEAWNAASATVAAARVGR